MVVFFAIWSLLLCMEMNVCKYCQQNDTHIGSEAKYIIEGHANRAHNIWMQLPKENGNPPICVDIPILATLALFVFAS